MSSPSCAAAGAIETVGGASSSVTVPFAVAPALGIVTLDGLESVTVKVSSSSSTVSSTVLTVKVFEVSPGAKVSVPFAAVNSVCAWRCRPLATEVAQATVIVPTTFQ